MATFLEKPVSAQPENPEAAKPAAHDLKPPQAFIEFMLKDWKPRPRRSPPRVHGHAQLAARRRALSALFPGEALIIPTGHEKARSNDTLYRFRPGSDFYYLTGNLEPDCVLVLLPRPEGGHADVLFVEENPGRSSATFFTDRVKGELWVGPRLGVEQSRDRYGTDETRGLTELAALFEKLRAGSYTASTSLRVLRGHSPICESALPFDGQQVEKDRQLATTLAEMRLIKDSLEVSALEKAIAATLHGFEDVIRALRDPASTSERHVEGVFNLRARVEGNDVGYNTIAAAGPHATILHWTRNDGPLEKGSLLLLDAGVEGHELYTADITRTLPIGGKFSKEQRAIYELVLEAQRAGFKAVKPGNDFLEPNTQAMRVLAHGLERLGILPTSAEEALRDENQFYKRYSLHNVSHMLGIDVHDCAQARQEVYRYGKLRAGMVLTVEPGLYFQPDDLTVPARYRGIGVRIEDDVLVTRTGCRVLSDDIPRETAEVERWMARLGKPARRRRS